jgi:DNA-binding helix-hairpin-helix protein with protein kinase domain
MSLVSEPLQDSLGGKVRLGGELGRGAEGAVYEVVGQPGRVAKIYHRPPTGLKAAKLVAMTTMKTEGLLSLAAWPVDVVQSNTNDTCGVLMQNVSGYKDIHGLYTPKSRKVEFSAADWRFLIRTAANLARAFAAVHATGCVIGDVNQGGVRVSPQATVKLIDCDSFQVAKDGRLFLCDVGTPDFTPPELQGRSFHGITRTRNHDNFGLAVLTFQLLCMGKHPFAGRYLGQEYMPIERAIQEYRFAYGAGRAAVMMEAPPYSVTLAALSSPIAELFERAFSRQSSRAVARPTAADWLERLGSLESQLKRCSANGAHYFLATLATCPWCELERASGSVLFNLYVPIVSPLGTVFDINAVWRGIELVSRPAPLGNEPEPGSIKDIRADPALRDRARQRRLRKFLGMSASVLCAAVLANVEPQELLYWLLAATSACIALWRIRGAEAEACRTRVKSAEAQYQLAQKAFLDGQEVGAFEQKIESLKKARDAWQGLGEMRRRRYLELQADRQRQQLKHFLEAIYIEKATIPSIGPGRKSMLQSYNVETAWDVTDTRVGQVPGFGSATVSKLLAWRQSVERRFRFDPSKAIDPREIAALDHEIANTRSSLEKTLLSGRGELTQIGHQRMIQCTALRTQMEEALRIWLQAQADLRAAS